jgi:hypothetical protein
MEIQSTGGGLAKGQANGHRPLQTSNQEPAAIASLS